MKILKKWNEHPDKLKAEGEPIDWFETTEAELLRHTEEAGYYAPGTVISALEEGAQLRTPSAFYKAVEQLRAADAAPQGA